MKKKKQRFACELCGLTASNEVAIDNHRGNWGCLSKQDDQRLKKDDLEWIDPTTRTLLLKAGIMPLRLLTRSQSLWAPGWAVRLIRRYHEKKSRRVKGRRYFEEDEIIRLLKLGPDSAEVQQLEVIDTLKEM